MWMRTRTSEVEAEEADVPEDGEDGRGHVVEGEPIEEEVHGVFMREAGGEEGVPANRLSIDVGPCTERQRRTICPSSSCRDRR